jgi:hypothetical protein
MAGDILLAFGMGDLKLEIIQRDNFLFLESPICAPVGLQLPKLGHYNTSTPTSTYDDRGAVTADFSVLWKSPDEAFVDVHIEDSGQYWYQGSMDDDWHDREPRYEEKIFAIRRDNDRLLVSYTNV